MTVCQDTSTGRQKSFRWILFTGCAVSTLLMIEAAPAYAQAVSAPALAQQQGGAQAAPDTIGEIIVTARLQSESLQKVPVSITAVPGKDLDRYNQTQIASLATQVPSLSITLGSSGSGASASLRGVGSSSISAAFDSAVALDFDGVTASSMRLLQGGVFDVAQVEVLKGPQSLYFGKSATAGVLSVKTAEPTAMWEGQVKLSDEFVQRGYSASGYISGPLTDHLGVRLAANYTNIAQQMHDVVPGVIKPDKGERDFNIQGTLNWKPSSTFRANLKFKYLNLSQDSTDGYLRVSCGANGVAEPIRLFGGAVSIPAGYSCNGYTGNNFFLPDAAPPLTVKGAGGQSLNGGSPYNKLDIYFTRLRMDWDVSHDFTLTSTTGYLEQDSNAFDEFSFGGVSNGSPVFQGVAAGQSFGVGLGPAFNGLKQFTEELRLASHFNGPFNIQIGGLYEHRSIQFNTAQDAANIALVAGPDAATGFTSDYYKQVPTTANAYSPFVSFTYEATDKFQLSGGVRWTSESKVATIKLPYVHAALAASGAFVSSGFDSGPIRYKSDSFSPEATLRYSFTPDVNVYASYKQGFKSGGIDNSVLGTASLNGFLSSNPAARAAAINSVVYKPETAKGGEIGLKSQLDDRKITLNVTGFYYVFTNLQVQAFNSSTIQFNTTNAGQVTTKGIEVESSWRTPVQGLRVFGAASLLDSKFTKSFIPDPTNPYDFNGRDVARAPHFSGNIGFDLREPVRPGIEFGLTGNLKYSGKFYANNAPVINTTVNVIQPAYAIADLAASLSIPEKGLEISLIGTNLSGKRFVNNASGRPFLSATGDDYYQQMSEGRKITLQLSAKF